MADRSVTKDLRRFMETGGPWFDYRDLLRMAVRPGTGKQALNKRLYYLLQRGDIIRSGGGSLSDSAFMLKSRDHSVDNESADVASPLIAAALQNDDGIAEEPEGTFKIIGNLVDPETANFMGTLVEITSPGWSDRPYIMKELP
jgi:hypothetical protein